MKLSDREVYKRLLTPPNLEMVSDSDITRELENTSNMTLDLTQFIDSKGGNADEIRESQRKRGHSVELVDEVIQMYADWVKSM